MRVSKSNAVLIYSSTNKVYGAMKDKFIIEQEDRYEYRDFPDGISEDQCLDFYSPYGCSKGAAEQYVIDYSRIYGLRTIVFRQSCIYGWRQFGIEDQGWVAWFTIAAALGVSINIYGNGKQVRDVLFVEDLIEAYDFAIHNIERTNGQAYNIGGGDFHMSLLELLEFLNEFSEIVIPVTYGDWRQGDQRIYISNITKAKRHFGWKPKTPVREGVQKLFLWVKKNKDIFVKLGLIQQ